VKTQPLNIVGGFYHDETAPFSVQDCSNYLPVMAEVDGTRTPTMLKTPPGLKPFAEPTYSPPTRGAWECEGRYFTAIGNKLYQLTNAGVFIELGTVPGVTQVSMSHNQQSQGQQLQIVNGSSGYIFNTFTQVFERITDTGFPGSLISLFIGGYFVGIDPRGRFAFTSAAADGLAYNTLDRFTSEYKPDKLVTGLAIGGELLLLSESSGEFFAVTSNPQQPMRTKQIYMDKGCAGTFTAAVMDNTGYWLGDDGVFYKLNGYSPVRISTQPIEQSLRSLLKTNPNAWRQARCFVWEDSGHSVCYWTFPTGHTWGYDAATGIWHRRESLGMDIWRVQTMTFWNSQWYAGDFQSGKVWTMDWNYILEGDEEFVSKRTTQVLHDNQCRVVVNRLELLMQVGQEETTPIDFPVQPEGPTLSGALPDGNLSFLWPGVTYTATGGTPPYTYTSRPGTAFIGNLGPMNSAGVVAAEIPNTIGTGTNIPRVTDANGLFDQYTDTFEITAPSYATTAGTDLVYTDTPYNWVVNVNVGDSVSQSLVESRNGKVFAFHADNSGGSVSSDGGGTWTLCTGLPAALKIVALVFADDTYIAVPASGMSLYVSTDGIAFTARSYASDSQVTDSAIAIDDVVIVGRSNSSQSRRSVDGGNTWANCPLVSPVQVWAFATSGTSIVAATNAVLLRSTDDGASWTSVGNPFAGANIASVAYGNGTYLSVSDSGLVRKSVDGVTWTSGTALPETLGGMGEGNEMVFDGINFVVACASHIFTSPNGTTWIQRTTISATALAFYRTGQ
jgi:hypothetical protein